MLKKRAEEEDKMKAETKQKLKPFVTVAVASVVTLAVYLLSSVVLVAIFREIEDKSLRALINAVIVTAAFGFILLYIAKIRNSAGEDEAISDCGARDGIPLAEELRQYRTIRRTRLDGSFCACYDVEILKNRLFSCDFSVKTGTKISRQSTHANCAVLP